MFAFLSCQFNATLKKTQQDKKKIIKTLICTNHSYVVMYKMKYESCSSALIVLVAIITLITANLAEMYWL